jgi:hypothetical protein
MIGREAFAKAEDIAAEEFTKAAFGIGEDRLERQGESHRVIPRSKVTTDSHHRLNRTYRQ